jgi:hypothetical protein
MRGWRRNGLRCSLICMLVILRGRQRRPVSVSFTPVSDREHPEAGALPVIDRRCILLPLCAVYHTREYLFSTQHLVSSQFTSYVPHPYCTCSCLRGFFVLLICGDRSFYRAKAGFGHYSLCSLRASVSDRAIPPLIFSSK